MMEKSIKTVQKKYGTQIAKKAFESGALKLSPDKPFTWASGYKMPIYNDNRRLLVFPEIRQMIATAFLQLSVAINFTPSIIAGVATGGIPHGTTLADLMKLPFSYIRSTGKEHGLENQIEGVDKSTGFQNKNVLVIEDLISTGGSSIKAIQAVRNAKGVTPYCFAIFSYGLDKASEAFAELNPVCKPITILNYDIMLDVAIKNNYITENQKTTLAEWRVSPFDWFETHSLNNNE